MSQSDSVCACQQAVDNLDKAINEILDPSEWEANHEGMHRSLRIAAVAQALHGYSKPLRSVGCFVWQPHVHSCPWSTAVCVTMPVGAHTACRCTAKSAAMLAVSCIAGPSTSIVAPTCMTSAGHTMCINEGMCIAGRYAGKDMLSSIRRLLPGSGGSTTNIPQLTNNTESAPDTPQPGQKRRPEDDLANVHHRTDQACTTAALLKEEHTN